ncbi:MAG: DMT family transporter [Proteobacteria bacterium]|nr:DMT family transporter [Pseudomonadota bacterium]
MTYVLYAVTVLLWGSSFYGITFQLGTVAPEASVTYRFALSAVVMFGFCLATGRSLRFGWRKHALFLALGAFMFSLNYIGIYLSELYIASGLTAVAFSSVVVFNIVFAAVLLRTRTSPWVLIGAFFGLTGIALIFWSDIAAFDVAGRGAKGFGLALLAAVLASLGTIVSAQGQRARIPVVQLTAYGMGYGAVIVALVTVVRGQPFTFEWSAAYVGSMAYLVLFASVLGFWFFFTLVGRLGPERAGNVMVMFPVVALFLSTLFEDFQWAPLAALGVLVVLLGNAFVLARSRQRPRKGDTVPAEV